MDTENTEKMQPVIIVHGGAWSVPDYWVQETVDGVKTAARIGYDILKKGGSSLVAIEITINYLEDNEVFNAGTGSSLNINGEVLMDASVQRGSDLKAGCVSLLKDVQYPISLARKVMEKTPHIYLAGDGAKDFALKQGCKLKRPEEFVTKEAKKELQNFKDQKISLENGKDTVGAVALDKYGNLVAGTSTGGTAGKYVGRIGDAPIIGCGTYADDEVAAVSCTGHGESIMKCCLSHTIVKLVESGLPGSQATIKAVEEMTRRVGNTGGAICITKEGEVGLHFTTERMSWAYVKDKELHYGIEPRQHQVEKCE